jgi:hypothetical protein
MGKLRWAPVLFERFHARECEARKTAWEREKAKAPSAKKKSMNSCLYSLCRITLGSRFQSLNLLDSHILAVLSVLFWLTFDYPVLAVLW